MASVIFFFSPLAAERALVAASAMGVNSISLLVSGGMDANPFFSPSLSNLSCAIRSG
jgi:hypothetical protein